MTGTDTGVGKTWVSCELLRWARAQGLTAAGLKAAESGGTDQSDLLEAAGGDQPERCQFRFEREVAPGVAADDLGQEIDFELIAGQVARLDQDVVVVEGAGGWMVPMGRSRMIADLAIRLGLPVVVVARATLGTINHSVLTAQAVQRSGVPLAAVVLNALPADDRELAARNCLEIRRVIDAPVLLVQGSVAELGAVVTGR